MSIIKLFSLGKLPDGTERFQSQLYIDKNTSDFIMDTDGIMKCYGRGSKGFDFYPYVGEYEIVSDIKEMKYQALN